MNLNLAPFPSSRSVPNGSLSPFWVCLHVTRSPSTITSPTVPRENFHRQQHPCPSPLPAPEAKKYVIRRIDGISKHCKIHRMSPTESFATMHEGVSAMEIGKSILSITLPRKPFNIWALQ
jgi:hypothetical protein